MNLKDFYDRYHQQNDGFSQTIGDNNFTYFYILRGLKKVSNDWSKKRILDVGCGVGTVLNYLVAKGAIGHGVDISPRAIKLAKTSAQKSGVKNISFRQGELKVHESKQNFEVVICSELIEHVEDEARLLKNIHSNLKADGILFLTTPSKDNLLTEIGYYKNFDKRVGHLRRYTTNTIRQLLTENGFKVESVIQTEGPLRNILFISKLGLLIRFIRGPLVPVFHLVDELSGLILGFSDIQVVAKKK